MRWEVENVSLLGKRQLCEARHVLLPTLSRGTPGTIGVTNKLLQALNLGLTGMAGGLFAADSQILYIIGTTCDEPPMNVPHVSISTLRTRVIE